MAVREVAPPATAPGDVSRHAFGLGLVGPFAPSGPGASTRSDRRRASWELSDAVTLDDAWPVADALRVLEFRFLDGRPMMTVDREPSCGYRIWAPGFGRHVVSQDGTRIRSALPRRSGRRWQRLFYAQVLPLAATLQGLELFHASAVSLAGGAAVALVAPSGTGKSSIAAHLVAGGGGFVTDDVLALEPEAGVVLAHPGPGFLNLDPSEVVGLSRAERGRLGPRIGRGQKVQLAPEPSEKALPLAAVCFLQRARHGSSFSLIEDDPPQPRALLASSVIPYVRSAERLENHLDACARVAESSRSFRVSLPEDTRARDSARMLRRRLEQLLGERR